jgi:hypothetical protein
MFLSGLYAIKFYFTTLPPRTLPGPQPGSETHVEGGVHFGPSHAYIPRSDSSGIERAALCVSILRFTGASEKNGCRLVAFIPLSSSSQHCHGPLRILPEPQHGFKTNVEGGVHLGPPHAIHQDRTHRVSNPRPFCVLGVRFTDASREK